MIRAAGILLTAPSGRVLFLQRSSVGDAAGMWSFPGGKLEDGEDAATAADLLPNPLDRRQARTSATNIGS